MVGIGGPKDGDIPKMDERTPRHTDGPARFSDGSQEQVASGAYERLDWRRTRVVFLVAFAWHGGVL